MDVFNFMKLEKDYTGIGGYLNSSNRTKKTDKLLLDAAFYLGITYSRLFLWVNSRYARHFMDQNHSDVTLYVNELRNSIPDLESESQ